MCRKSKETDVLSQLVSVGDVSRKFQVSSHLRLISKGSAHEGRGRPGVTTQKQLLSRMTTWACSCDSCCRMTTCRQPEPKYNPLLPHLIVFILITIKFSESCQSSTSCSLNICLLLCTIAPPLPERVSRAKTNIINLESWKMNLWPTDEN